MDYMADLGIFEIALPFLLIFTIVFAMLQKSKILGPKAKNFNVVIALVIGILVVRNEKLVALLNSFLPNVSMFIVIFLMLLLLIAVFLKEDYKGWGNNIMAVAGIFSVLAIIWSLSVDYIGDRFQLPGWLTNLDSRTKSMIIFVAIFVIIIWLVTKEDKEKEGSSVGKFFTGLGKELKGE